MNRLNLAAMKAALKRPCTNCGAKPYVPCHGTGPNWGVCGTRLLTKPPGR